MKQINERLFCLFSTLQLLGLDLGWTVAHRALRLGQTNCREVLRELLPAKVIGLGPVQLEDGLGHGETDKEVNLSSTIAT